MAETSLYIFAINPGVGNPALIHVDQSHDDHFDRRLISRCLGSSPVYCTVLHEVSGTDDIDKCLWCKSSQMVCKTSEIFSIHRRCEIHSLCHTVIFRNKYMYLHAAIYVLVLCFRLLFSQVHMLILMWFKCPENLFLLFFCTELLRLVHLLVHLSSEWNGSLLHTESYCSHTGHAVCWCILQM